MEFYANAPITLQELNFLPVIRKMQKIILHLSPSQETFSRLVSTIGSRRILLAKPATLQERDPKYVRHRGKFAVFKYWNRKGLRNTKYIVETDETKITGIMSKYDEKLPIMDLNNILFFKQHSNCPLASIYGVLSLPFARSIANRKGEDGKMCPSLTMTCCAIGSLKSFTVDSKVARFNLKAYYKNQFRLNKFLVSGLVDNFKLLPEDEYNAECQGPQNRSKCLSLMLNIKSAIALANKHADRYGKD